MPDGLNRRYRRLVERPGWRILSLGRSLEGLRLGETLVIVWLGLGKTRVNCRWGREILPVKLLGGRFVLTGLRYVKSRGVVVRGRRGGRRRGGGRDYRRHNIKPLGRFFRWRRSIKLGGRVFRRQGKAPGFFIGRQLKALSSLVVRLVNRGNGRGRRGPVLGGLGAKLAHNIGPAGTKAAFRPVQRRMDVLPDPADHDWIFQYLRFFFVPVVRSVKYIIMCQRFALY